MLSTRMCLGSIVVFSMFMSNTLNTYHNSSSFETHFDSELIKYNQTRLAAEFFLPYISIKIKKLYLWTTQLEYMRRYFWAFLFSKT